MPYSGFQVRQNTTSIGINHKWQSNGSIFWILEWSWMNEAQISNEKMCHITINFYNFTPFKFHLHVFTAEIKYPLNWTGRRTFLSKFQYGDNFQTITSLSPILYGVDRLASSYKSFIPPTCSTSKLLYFFLTLCRSELVFISTLIVFFNKNNFFLFQTFVEVSSR